MPLRVAWYTLTNGAPPPTLLRDSRKIRARLTPSVLKPDNESWGVTGVRGTVLARTLWWLVEIGHLPALLRYEDRNSMAFGIEARVPFLDHRLVDFAMLLPDRLKVAGGRRKVALARAMAGLVPDSVLDRTDKIGFASPERRWLQASMPALRRLGEKAHAERMGLLRPATVTWATEAWDRGQIAPDVYWRILSLELWTRIVVNREREVLAA
jgi:asparagine synthase (glutamine-hydrolysing)